jgi:hypothetical protein
MAQTTVVVWARVAFKPFGMPTAPLAAEWMGVGVADGGVDGSVVVVEERGRRREGGRW